MTNRQHWKRVIENVGLVKKFMSKNQWLLDKSFALDEKDYLAIGSMSLFNASLSWNKKRSLFSTYAMHIIKHDLLRAYQNQAFPIMRVPVYLHEGLNHSSEEVDTRALRAARLSLLHHAIPEMILEDMAQ